jgi:F-type H+-transporting ATPase subunit gamma
LSATLDADSGSTFAEQREVKNVLLVAITSNRGLCGAFNSNIIKQVNSIIEESYSDTKVSIMAIGKKANDAFVKSNRVIANNSEVFDDLTFDHVAEIADFIMQKFVDGEFDKVEIIYNSFKNASNSNCNDRAVFTNCTSGI